jgi:hypothetical protein
MVVLIAFPRVEICPGHDANDRPIHERHGLGGLIDRLYDAVELLRARGRLVRKEKGLAVASASPNLF